MVVIGVRLIRYRRTAWAAGRGQHRRGGPVWRRGSRRLGARTLVASLNPTKARASDHNLALGDRLSHAGLERSDAEIATVCRQRELELVNMGAAG
jgi:hypothetical protein